MEIRFVISEVVAGRLVELMDKLECTTCSPSEFIRAITVGAAMDRDILDAKGDSYLKGFCEEYK